jgi:hypothetical protein
MSAEEVPPVGRTLTTRRNAFGLQDAGNRRPGDTMTKILQRSLDARVPPARIVRRHADNQASDLDHHSRSARPLSRVGPFLRNQIAMPSEMVSGVTSVATLRSMSCPSRRPSTASLRR